MTPLLEVEDLKTYFPIRKGLLRRTIGQVKAVDGVSFTIAAGETLGLVGESGCGKSTAGRSILRLLEPTAGQVKLNGRRIDNLAAAELRSMRRELQVIFQDPYSSLSPRLKVGSIIAEPLRNFGLGSGDDIRQRVRDLVAKVGLRPDAVDRYPHQFSGGQRQRIGIARALALNPKLIICDEPVSALDVSVQAQVVNLLKDLQAELGLSYLFIAHDMAVVEHVSHRIAVMYLGKIVEIGSRRQILAEPLHPYTQALLSAVPVPNPKLKRQHIVLKGDVPSPANPPSGCRFHTRCPYAFDRCRTEEPLLVRAGPDQSVACHLTAEADQVDQDGRP
jgi:oligopeptide/dipeptide ABC transporter ATP-binding protein